jgi:predicted peroxiredoxin
MACTTWPRARISFRTCTILAAGTLTLCTQCAVRREIKEGDLITGIRVAGAAAYVEEITAEATQALIY